jgi:hypothetical protein
MPAEFRPGRPSYNPREQSLPQDRVPIYSDVKVSPQEEAVAKDYLRRAPKAQVIHKELGDTAIIDVAIHDTTFSIGRKGRALGGIRHASNGRKLAPELGADMQTKYLVTHEMFERGDAPEELREAARHDGGKAVLWAEDPLALQGDRRIQVMKKIGHFIRDLNGLYVPGADLGTGEDDLLIVSQAAGEGVPVACKKGDIPTSEITAVGVHHAFEALVDHKREKESGFWNNLKVTFQGVGHVGQPLLVDMFTNPKFSGIKYTLAEPKRENVTATIESLREKGVTKEEIQSRISVLEDPRDPEQLNWALEESHVFMPNAIAGQVNLETLSHMPEGSAYVGAGNDIIPKIGYQDDPDVLNYALSKGITGVAAYQANCGGIAAIAIQDTGGTIEEAKERMVGVYQVVRETLSEAKQKGVTPEAVAADRAARHFAQFVKARNISL